MSKSDKIISCVQNIIHVIYNTQLVFSLMYAKHTPHVLPCAPTAQATRSVPPERVQALLQIFLVPAHQASTSCGTSACTGACRSSGRAGEAFGNCDSAVGDGFVGQRVGSGCGNELCGQLLDAISGRITSFLPTGSGSDFIPLPCTAATTPARCRE